MVQYYLNGYFVNFICGYLYVVRSAGHNLLF